MDARRTPDRQHVEQRLADICEDLQVDRWKIAYPAHMRLLKAIDEAARRAAALARLEDAIAHLS